MAWWPQIARASTTHFHFFADGGSAPVIQWPVLLHRDYKINVYSSSHGLKSHHLLSAVNVIYLTVLQCGVK